MKLAMTAALDPVHPQSALAIQSAIDGHLLQRLGVFCEPLETVEIAFEMPECPPDQACTSI